MKVGDNWNCPRCGKNSFLKRESVLDGWRKIGEILKCASCGMTVEEITPEPAAASSAPAPEKKHALADLLGGAEETVKPDIFAGEEKRFCRDCAFRVANAFRLYCTQHDREVNPMDDCPEYQPRSEKNAESERKP